MPESATARIIEVPAPEPDLTPHEIIARAQALIPLIRDQQEEAEKLGHHTETLDREFVNAGFYRMLQPRRFGGYEFDMPTFWKAMIAVLPLIPARTGWGLTLGTHHALVVGAYFPEDGQREIFGLAGVPVPGPRGAHGHGRACRRRLRGQRHVGLLLRHRSCHPLHGQRAVPARDGQDTPVNIVVVMPRDQVTVLDDWGDGVTLGMNSSGSNGVRADGVFVPARCTSVSNWTRMTEPARA